MISIIWLVTAHLTYLSSFIIASDFEYDSKLQAVLSKAINSCSRNKNFFNLSSNIQRITPPDDISVVSTVCGEDTELNKRIGCCKPTDTRYIWNAKVENKGFILYSTTLNQPTPSPAMGECKEMAAKYGVIPGRAWGSITAAGMGRWKELNCDSEYANSEDILPRVKAHFVCH